MAPLLISDDFSTSKIPIQNSKLKIPKRPPLEKIGAFFRKILLSGKTQENAVFARFNVC